MVVRYSSVTENVAHVVNRDLNVAHPNRNRKSFSANGAVSILVFGMAKGILIILGNVFSTHKAEIGGITNVLASGLCYLALRLVYAMSECIYVIVRISLSANLTNVSGIALTCAVRLGYHARLPVLYVSAKRIHMVSQHGKAAKRTGINRIS